MKKKYTKILLPITTGLFILTFAFSTVASIDSKTASEFSQYCAQNPNVCNKVDFNEARAGTVSCPSVNQAVSEVFVHAGDGQTVYKLPHDGFDYTASGNSVTVTLNGHTHNISWIGVVCNSVTPTPSPTPTPTVVSSPTPTSTPSVTPSPTPSSTPSPTPSVVPSPTPTTGGNSQEQNQTQTNNQTVNVTVTGQVAGVKTPTIQPETGVSTLAFATMFGAAPFGLLLRKFSRTSRNKVNLSEFASELMSDKAQK